MSYQPQWEELLAALSVHLGSGARGRRRHRVSFEPGPECAGRWNLPSPLRTGMSWPTISEPGRPTASGDESAGSTKTSGSSAATQASSSLLPPLVHSHATASTPGLTVNRSL